MNPAPRPLGLLFLLVCLLVIGVGGVYGGIVFLADPSGGLMGVDITLLQGLPLQTFTLPGLFLLFVMGVLPLGLIPALWFRPSWSVAQQIWYRSHDHWAWTATLLFGVVLLGWLGFQSLILGFGAPAQWFTFIFGLALVGLCLLPGVRRYYHLP